MSGATTVTVSSTPPMFVRGDRLNIYRKGGPSMRVRVWRATGTVATICYPWSLRWCWLAIEDAWRWCRRRLVK